VHAGHAVRTRTFLLRSRLVRTALALAVLCQQGCLGGGEEEQRGEVGAPACDLPLPEFAAGTDAAELEEAADGPLAAGVAGRDASVTVVGYCQPSSRFPEPAPAVIEGDRALHPIGGELQKTPSGWRNYYLYPPTLASQISIRQGGSNLGVADFAAAPQNGCSLRARRPFEVLACGAIVLLDWSSPLPFDADRVTLVDVNAVDGGDPRRQLNYYDLGYRNGPRGLQLRFGIRRPSTRRVELQLNYVYVRNRKGSVDEIPLRASQTFALRAARPGLSPPEPVLPLGPG
jgi:hypothetical protein